MTPELDRAPTDEELDDLEELLSGKVDLFDPDFKGDAGILTVSALEGFLAAVVSGPTMIPPSVWMKRVWGDYPPVWETEAEAMSYFGTIFRLMNFSADALMNRLGTYQPLFADSEDEPDEDFVDFWCSGYVQGVALWDQSFKTDRAMDGLLLPILANSAYCPENLSDKIDEEQRVVMKESIPACAQRIHKYWLERRGGPRSGSQAPSRPEAGANDPCPCGSGMKYKKCCRGN